MGTTITISLVDERADSLIQKSFDLLRELEYRFNANSQESELMEINHQAGIAPVKVHPDLFELISLGLEHSLAPSSHLNISIGPLIQTWRIGFSDAKVASLKKSNQFSLNQSSLYRVRFFYFYCVSKTERNEDRPRLFSQGL